jgi:hypothetical protein
MEEQAAREVVLLRAIETTDATGALLTAEDRRYAGRAAAELAHWQASQQRTAATDELFLAKRAGLALDVLSERTAAIRMLRRVRWRPWLGITLPAVAFALGALVEQVADRQHVNVLAFPLLGIIAWNLVVYVVLLLRPLLGRSVGPLRRWFVGSIRLPKEAGDPVVANATARFAADWADLSRPLLDARAGRVLHLAAALFALGALAGLYLRAIAFEYRIGWESTFLQASSVHAILATLLGPAARLLGMPFPTVEAIEAMRISGAQGGTDAGPWIHLYAVTVGVVVIFPRLMLAAFSAWQEGVRTRNLRLDLSTPYFRRVLAAFAPQSARVRVAPYSYTLDESAVGGLSALARHLLGDATQLALRPSTDFGAEDHAADGVARLESDVPLTLAVFNATSVPENENHGRFIDALRNAVESRIAAVVDLAPYRKRLGAQAGADERIDQRARAWQAFAAERALILTCIELSNPDLVRAERELAAALGTGA